MSNHVHLLVWPTTATYSAVSFLDSLKGRMATDYRSQLLATDPDKYQAFLLHDKSKGRQVFRFWQAGRGFDVNLWNPRPIHHATSYVEGNPVRRELLTRAEEYRWSSAWAGESQEVVAPDRFTLPLLLLSGQRQQIVRM
jgi:putative transposase